MESDDLARRLLDLAEADEQTVHRIRRGENIAPVRRAIRRLARERALRIRTALIDDTLIVVRADAQIWRDDTATMRAKLTPPAE